MAKKVKHGEEIVSVGVDHGLLMLADPGCIGSIYTKLFNGKFPKSPVELMRAMDGQRVFDGHMGAIFHTNCGDGSFDLHIEHQIEPPDRTFPGGPSSPTFIWCDLRSEHDYTIVEGSPKLIPSTPSAPDFYRKAFEAGRVYERANPRRPASEEELTKLYARAAGPVIAARRRRTAKEMAGWEKKRAAERKTFEREAKKAGVSYDEYMEAYWAKKREEIAASQELPNRA